MNLKDLYTLNPDQIVMYSTEYCSDCQRARMFFDDRGIKYLQVSLEGNQEATEFVMQVNNGLRIVPTIIFPDGTFLVEPSQKELGEKLSAP